MVELVPTVKTSGEILYRERNIFDANYGVEELTYKSRNGISKSRILFQNPFMTILRMDLEFMG